VSAFIWIPPQNVGDVWSDIEPLVLQALLKTGSIDNYDPHSIKELLETARFQLWITATDRPICVTITEVITFPKRKVLTIFLNSSEPHTEDQWFHNIKELARFGHENGCTAVRIGGRKGWARKFHAEQTQTFFTIPIGNVNGK